MRIPNIKFLIKPKEDILIYFIFEKEAKIFDREHIMDVYFFKNHPTLRMLKKIKNKKKKEKLLSDYVVDYYRKHNVLMQKRIEEIEERWNKVKYKFFNLANKLFQNYPWPQGPYTAFVTIWNIFPRDISDKTFQLPYKGRSFKRVEAIIAHEMLHFLFYSYLFKHFPKYKKSRYSYAVWVLSEAFNEAVMKEKEWRELFPSLPPFYSETHPIRKKIMKLRKVNKDVEEIMHILLPIVAKKYTIPPSF